MMSVHNRVRKELRVLLVLWWAVFSAMASEITLIPGEEQFVFGGSESKIEVRLQNENEESKSPELAYRLFQESSSTIAPVGEKRRFEGLVLAPKATTIVPVSIEFPAVRVITPFQLKISDSGPELGVVRIRVCPTNLFSGLKLLAPEVAIFERHDLLQPLLAGSDIKVQPLSSSFSGKLCLIRLGSREEEMDWLDQKMSIEQPTIYIVSPGVTSFERLLPVKPGSNGHAAIVQDWFVPELKSSPLSQLRLLHTAEVLLKPGSVKLPGSVKPKN